MEISIIISALSLGLASSFHCIGMCGPIALTLNLDKVYRNKMLIQNFVYQIGRVTTYTMMGLFLSPFLSVISIKGWQGWVSIIAGVLMIFSLVFNFESKLSAYGQKILAKPMVLFKIKLQKYITQNSYQSLYTTGILNGFLPCAMVYTAMIASFGVNSTAHSWYYSAIYMFLFGLGTIPMMFLIVLSKHIASVKWRYQLEKMIPFVVAIVGIMLIIRGYSFLSSGSCCTH